MLPDLFDLFDLFDSVDLFGLLDDGGGSAGGRFDPGPKPAELLRQLAREARKRRLTELIDLEYQRRCERIGLPEFRRRYTRLAHREPGDDPARQPPYGPNSAALERFVARVSAAQPADWRRAEEHLRNLQANPVLRKSLVERYCSVVEIVMSSARLSAAAALGDAIRESIPEERRHVWELALAWLPMALVTIDGPVESAGVLPLAPLPMRGTAGSPQRSGHRLDRGAV